MDFELKGTKTLYIYQCSDYEAGSGLTDLSCVIKNSDQLKEFVHILTEREVSGRKSCDYDSSSRCSSYYLLSQALNFSAITLFDIVGERIEALNVLDSKSNNVKYHEELDDTLLESKLYEYCLSQINLEKLNDVPSTIANSSALVFL